MPQNKRALLRTPMSSDCLKKIKPQGPLPGDLLFNTVYPDSMRCLQVSLRCGSGVHTVATPGLKSRDSMDETCYVNKRGALKDDHDQYYLRRKHIYTFYIQTTLSSNS